MSVGTWVICSPIGAAALRPIAAIATTAITASHGRVHEPCESPLAFFEVIGRDGEVFVFETLIFAEGTLEREEA